MLSKKEKQIAVNTYARHIRATEPHAERLYRAVEAVLAERKGAKESKPEGLPNEGEHCWGRIYIQGREDIVGPREMNDGSIEYLCHNEGLCNPCYLATNGKPDARPMRGDVVQRMWDAYHFANGGAKESMSAAYQVARADVIAEVVQKLHIVLHDNHIGLNNANDICRELTLSLAQPDKPRTKQERVEAILRGSLFQSRSNKTWKDISSEIVAELEKEK